MEKVITGGFTDNGDDEKLALARFNTNGTLDSTFGSDGKVVQAISSRDEAVRGLAVQSDGKILAVDAGSWRNE